MWLCTQHGFYSIVQKKPGEFHIRARKKRDLLNLQEIVGPSWSFEIHCSPSADYRWRAVVDRDLVAAVMSVLGSTIDYSNFKERIHNRPDQEEKYYAYSQLWSNLYELQQ